ncbi:sensor histidine kinase [Nocardioides rubriscoriae]|uniref:sensor histidine kinase n=1 Tax=Nocardioides rubriscoriae TaxID=642762 RepID=UPI0014781095|nr:HAMP domain-containing sensor histidine kinase [Nocardioides rubriscoriae]
MPGAERNAVAAARRVVAWAWQVPPGLLAVCVVPLPLTSSQRDVLQQADLAAGLAVVAAATVVAVCVPWERLVGSWWVVVPLLDLVAAALVHLGGSRGLSSSLRVVDLLALVLVVLPTMWLSTELGVVGLAVGVTAALAMAVVPVVATLGPPVSTSGWIDLALPAVACLCVGLPMLLVTRTVARHEQAAEGSVSLLAPDQRRVTLHEVLAGFDAAVAVVLDGRPAVCNARADDLVARGAVDPTDPAAGPRARAADGSTRVGVDDQVVARAARGETWSGLVQWIGPDDEQVAVLSSCHEMADDHGARIGVVLVGWDVTSVLASTQGREQRLTTVSHELRAPVTSIIGCLEVLHDTLPDSAVDSTSARLLAIVHRNAAVLLARVDHLLLGAPTNQVVLDRRRVDLSLLTRDATDKHRVLAERHQARLHTRIATDLLCLVDATAYEQVLDNLVTNALKYSGPGGDVTVALERAERAERAERPTAGDAVVGAVVLTVTDTGMGMSPTECRHAFDRFYRSPLAARQDIQGLGIGLAVTRTLVELHGGVISLRSEPGTGTEVTVVLPADAPVDHLRPVRHVTPRAEPRG